MKLQFDASQGFQLDAMRAVVDLFKGQPDASQSVSVASFTLADDRVSSLKFSETGVANQRVITDEQWLVNLHAVQQAHGIEPSAALQTMTLDDGTAVGEFPNFTVEMETGTGKTYIYLRTVLELSKTYGCKKFVIVVPSVAIREGVLKSLQNHPGTLPDLVRLREGQVHGVRLRRG